MKERNHTCNLILGKRNNGFVRCSECGCILAYINYDTCPCLFIHFICKCGNSGYLELGNINNTEEKEFITADLKDGSICCRECGSRWFEVGLNVKGFAFTAQCICGESSNNYYERKRELYQIQRFKNTKQRFT